MDHLVLGRRAVLVHPVKSRSIAVSIIACCISLACHWFSVLSTMINSPNRGKKGCWNKQAKLKYKPNGCIDYSMKSIIMPLQVFFVCVHCVCVWVWACMNVFVQTYNRARDSTQTLWTGFSWRSLGSNWSCFTCWTLSTCLTLYVDMKVLLKPDLAWRIQHY